VTRHEVKVDREALMLFMQTIAQTLGPDVMANYMNPSEAIKRLAASAGIDYLGLVKTEEQLGQEQQAQQWVIHSTRLIQWSVKHSNTLVLTLTWLVL
jgi:hypothetical protein